MAESKPNGEHSAPGLARLPPGRHGLPREFVVENQRARLTAGMIATVAEGGYVAATVSQIAEAAGVSRRTFYSYFSSKEECYLDAYGQLSHHVAEAMGAAAAEQGEWPAKVGARLRALLELFAANPDLVRFALIAPPRAGGAIADHYRDQLACLRRALVEDAPPAAKPPSGGAQQALAGGLAALIVAKVREGDGEHLPDLAPDLLELILTPYLGRNEAVRVARN